MRPLLLINPNTNVTTTTEMVGVARKTAPAGVHIEGATALRGAPLIVDDEKLAIGAKAVGELADTLDLSNYAGIIVSAFGDPGMDALRSRSPVPVTGIAEAGIIEAANGGRRFSVVTTTPGLVSAIRERVCAYGYGHLFAGVRLTEGDAAELMDDPNRLEAGLAHACEAAIGMDAAEAIIIGGGPLAVFARALQPRFSIPIVEPVPAAVRLAAARAGAHVEPVA